MWLLATKSSGTNTKTKARHKTTPSTPKLLTKMDSPRELKLILYTSQSREGCSEGKGEVFLLVECRSELGIDTRIDAVDGPTMAEADEAYKSEQGANIEAPAAMVKMSHIKVTWPAWKTIAESKDEVEVPKVTILPGSILHKEPCMCCLVKKTMCTGLVGHTCDDCMCMKQGCKRLMKSVGKKAQVGMSTVQSSKSTKASSSKRVADNNNNDEVEVVKSHLHMKEKVLVCGMLKNKVVANLLQLLRLLWAKAMESQAAYLQLQVCVNQLAKALEKIVVE
ncbi:hypothetical protein F5J12DRAFT_781789 [Pisolithus orientalis]|uniref:uncharacterized protein n=1 Tax=Pisolithus orientalis TaxID=936130 RepID=UPI0022254655|nr:uncharacterized protein F5J12DRAFT_781789 [Pisolithus orientalis]KAI6010806.1 hypothetical protein F5J12DRAFT_781789 [Pisolithus orientalis]